MKHTLTVACIPSKSAWQAVCLPFLMLLRRLSPLRSGSLRSALTTLLLAPLAALHAVEPSAPQFVDVFVSGQDGYPNYRIPSLVVTGKGTLLALCEGRTKNDDHAANDLVLRRSSDGGKSWLPLQLVRDEGEATCNDPVMTALDSGRVLLFFARFPADAHTKEVVPGLEGKVTRHFVMHSDDDGVTWSAPREVTRMVKPANAQATSQGAGAGIQLKSGAKKERVLIPMWQRVGEGEKVETFAFAAISDDGGETWHHSRPVPHGRGDGRPWHNISEGTLVELNDGRVMMNGRNANGPVPFHRKLSFSADAGETWPFSRVLVPGAFRYNCLAQLPDGTMLCVFGEGPTKTPKVTIARFSLDWLAQAQP